MEDSNESKILIVDDKHENLFAMSKLLKYIDAEIITAKSGEEALGQVLRHNFALILLDVQMPGMDGFETAQLIHANQSTANVPIIFVTAISKEEKHAQSGYNVGAVDYLHKPINKDILLSKVNVFLQLDKQRKELENMALELKGLSEQNRLLIESAGEGIIGFNDEGKIIMANPAAGELIKIRHKELIHQSVFQWFVEPSIENILKEWNEKDEFDSVYHVSCKLRSKGGELLPIEFNLSPMMNSKSKLKGAVLMFQDITERLKLEEHLQKMAKYDGLTGLANRILFNEFLTASIASSQRRNKSTGVMFIDLDKFKPVNDTLGHDAGDTLLKSVAQRLRNNTREGDLIARLGGDEFAIVLDDLANPEDIHQIAKKLLDGICQPYQLNENELNIGASIGIAVSSFAGEDPDILTKAADAAMYATKNNGRNGYSVFDETMKKHNDKKQKMEACLKNDISLGNLKLYYQPVVALKNHEVISLEAQPCWNYEGKLWEPDEFASTLKTLRLSRSFCEWTIINACKEIAQWQKSSSNAQVKLSLDISLIQLENKHFKQHIEDVLKKSDFPPSSLELEISEYYLQSASEQTYSALKALNKNHVNIAINHFGSGNSSLSLLRCLPVNTVKLDSSFIKDIGKDKSAEGMIRAIIGLVHDMGIQAVAEGVETPEQLQFVESLSCDSGQGKIFTQSNMNILDNFTASNKLKLMQ